MQIWHPLMLCCALMFYSPAWSHAQPAQSPADMPVGVSPYKLALPPYQFQFPRDHAAHPDYQTEWWYYTGHLSSEGHSFGYELTFFQVGINPALKTVTSRWSLHTLYFAHLAVTDETGQTFFHTQQIGRPSLEMAGSLTDRYRVWIGDWFAELADDQRTHRLQASSGEYRLSLDLTPAKAPVIHGRNGVSQKASEPGRASHYYSMPRMRTTGTLTIKGTQYRVTGQSWMDHEFGTNQLTSAQTGWDWYSIQLDNNRELMLYALRLRDGSIERVSSGTIIHADGTWNHLSREAFTVERTATWTSPKTGGVYPAGWIIRVPDEAIELQLTPTVADQELVTGGLIGVIYWEGSVHVDGHDHGKRVTGMGYVELTGYVGRIPGL